MKKFIGTIILGTFICMALAGCGARDAQESAAQGDASEEDAPEGDTSKEDASETEVSDVSAVTANIVVNGYEWGPGVPKVVIELSGDIDSVARESASITTAEAERTISDIYLSDENGNQVDGSSKFVTFDMNVEYISEGAFGSSPGSPFTYDFMVTKQNNWSEEYIVDATCTVSAGEKEYNITYKDNCIDNRISEAAIFSNRGSKTGSYVNPMTDEKEELTLKWAAYEPEGIAGGEKNPLIIWLHGQGEGGNDPEIAILGNEVTALADEDIQSCFTAGEETGAYVLVPQCQTYWMDGGDGTNSNGDVESRYTKILMDTIEEYAASNPDIDTDRIYLGGCSNGGYMTIEMLVSYPEYFAAAFPCCEAYSFYTYLRDDNGAYITEESEDGWSVIYTETEERWFTDEKAQKLKDIPMWFIQSADDTTVDPVSFGLPTYKALLEAGATNCWYSFFENIHGTDAPDAAYVGHYSWVYLFNNQVTSVQNTDDVNWDRDSLYGFTPSNNGGGSQAVGEYNSIYEWLNSQKK